jgi:3-deoxy-D-manno-octulosonic acid (KDO) 8-phosphate synthase
MCRRVDILAAVEKTSKSIKVKRFQDVEQLTA